MVTGVSTFFSAFSFGISFSALVHSLHQAFGLLSDHALGLSFGLPFDQGIRFLSIRRLSVLSVMLWPRRYPGFALREALCNST